MHPKLAQGVTAIPVVAIFYANMISSKGRLAQLVRALPLHGRGRGFEPSIAQVMIRYASGFWGRGVAWSNTSDCQSEDRGFKSRRPRHMYLNVMLHSVI
jgi:hypothetical protein